MTTSVWVPVVAVADIPAGGLYRFEVGEAVRLLVRTDDGMFALDGICTHEQAELCDGDVEGDTLWCPLHAAGFAVRTGEVVCPPAERRLQSYAVDVRDGMVWVSRDAV